MMEEFMTGGFCNCCIFILINQRKRETEREAGVDRNDRTGLSFGRYIKYNININ